ncbi:MAG TPA: sugar phosphate isomerase/epimerase family protein [Fimbriimonas sp.]
MNEQAFESKNRAIREAFLEMKRARPEAMARRLNLSWSNWGFGMESLPASAERLARNGIRFIELHGNLYGPDLGYEAAETRKILADSGLACSGICGMFSAENDLASNQPAVRQRAIDYIRRNVEFGAEVGASYFLIVPAAVGRPKKIDDTEFERSVETLRRVGHVFEDAGIRGAIEPIRSAEVSIVHTFDEALRYIEAVGLPGVRHINGDVYHMQSEEPHIADAVWKAGERLTNLHLADSNRCALGEGSLDLDTLIMALYLIGYNNERCFATPEPLGPGGDPYPAMFGKPDKAVLDALVRTTVQTWNEREEAVRSLSEV